MAIRATITVVRASADTKHISLSAKTTNVNAEAIAFVNPDSKNQWFYETATLSDVQFSLVEKNLSETVTLNESSIWEFAKNAPETLALVESFTKVVTFNRAFTDAFTLDDLSQIDKDFYGNKGNVAFMLDIIGLDQEKVLTDSYTVSDVVNLAVAFVRDFTDSYSFTDTDSYEFIKNVEDAFTLDDTSLINKDFYGDKGNVFGFSDLLGSSFGKTLTDSISQLDEVSILQGLNKSDSTTLSDTYRTTLNKAISDAFTLDDALQVDKDYFGNKGNVFAFSDVLSYEASKDLTDGIALVELVGFVLNHPVEDSYTVSDVNTLNPNLGKSDSVGFSDTYIRNIIKGLSDGFALDDTAQVNKDTDSAKGNIFSFSDVFSRTVSYDRDYTDSFGFSDTFSRTVGYVRAYSDSYSLNDTRGVHLTKAFVDTFKVYDENPNALNVNLLNSQAMNAQDTSFLVHRGLDKGDALGFSEITAFVHSKGLTDSAIVVDSSSVSLNKPKTDSFGISDNNVVASGVNPSDSISFSDSHDRTLSKALSDAFALDDSALINKDFTGSKGNVFGFSDVLSKTVGFNRAFTDAFSFSDDSVRSLNKGINDSSVLNDLLSFSQTKKMSESLTFNDVFGVQLEKTLSDTFKIYDENPNALNVNLLNSQAMNAQDTSFLVHRGLDKGDALGFSEITAFVHSKGLTDSAIVVDSSSVSLNKPKTDSFGISDNNVVASGVNPSDSISFSDSHDRTLSKVLSDAFALDDSALINKDFTGNKGNIFGLSEVVSLVASYKRAFNDSVAFSDSINSVLNKNTTETFTLGETLGFTSSKILGESLTFNDDYGLQLEKTLSDALALDDSALINKDYFGNKGNMVGLSDLITVNLVQSNQLGMKALNTMSFN